jgi:hypothetical protein
MDMTGRMFNASARLPPLGGATPRAKRPQAASDRVASGRAKRERAARFRTALPSVLPEVADQ